MQIIGIAVKDKIAAVQREIVVIFLEDPERDRSIVFRRIPIFLELSQSTWAGI